MGIEVDEMLKKKTAIEFQSRMMETKQNDKKEKKTELDHTRSLSGFWLLLWVTWTPLDSCDDGSDTI